MSEPSRTPLVYEVVIPSVGRPSLHTLLESLAAAGEPQPAMVHVVDGTGRGPAVARNLGWRAASAPWVVFLDDDVVVPPGWCAELADDLARLEPRAAGSQGRIRVPASDGAQARARLRTGAGSDWARNVTKLETATWATADMAYRRRVLAAVGGFDEHFPRAYREDADLGLRVVGAGWTIEPGRRVVLHPVRPERPWVSVRAQRGNADDALMRRLHGRGWQHRARAGRGRRPLHLAATAGWLAAATGSAVLAGLSLRPGLAAVAPGLGRPCRRATLAGAAVGAGLTAELFAHRLRGARRQAAEADGRVGPGEIAWLAATSAAIPPAAAWHTARGWFRARRLVPSPALSAGGPGGRPARWEPPAAVLFDRDGTLVHDVPYNGDPARVELRPDALPALARLRAAGVKVGLVTNQSGVALGLIGPDQVEAVNRRLAELAGPFDTVVWCPHGPDDGCGCRKPAPGMVLAAARALGVPPERCAVVGDTGADVGAALAAGARGVLVPNDVTAFAEIEAAAETAADLVAAVDRLLGPPPRSAAGAAPPVPPL